ncbi:Ig-like domain-containing protein, partial [Nocardioides sp.]|uniref:beta strand repeat-containing protein n=1 Tax=Nocardioides sp. TaxID=35761 RepID=UPI002619A12D
NGTTTFTGTGVTYVPDADYCNTGTGGTADTFSYALNGGSSATASVTVTCVDDAPVAVGDSRTLMEDAGATALAPVGNDTDVDGGPTSITSVTQPANGTVVITGGGTGLTYAPNANFCTAPDAVDAFTYTLNGVSTATVSMTITCVNDAPVADDETVAGAIGNTTLIGNDSSDGAPTVGHISRTVSADLLGGDSDVDGPGPLVVTAGTFATNDGGSVVLEADGDFVYSPAAATSCTDTSDFFDYTLSDGATVPATDTGRVTITLTDCVWYVSNNATGNAGTSSAPFDTLAQAQTASTANHTIYLFDGDNTAAGYSTGFDLKAGQRLLGEAADLQVAGALLRSATPTARPRIADTDADVVVLAAGNTVRGIEVDPQGAGGGIFGGGAASSGTIQDVTVDDLGVPGTQPGLELDSTTGTWAVSGLVVKNGGSSGATGIRLNNAGTVNLGTAVGPNTVSTSSAKALDLTGTALGTSSALAEVVVSGSAVGAVSLVDTTGTISLGDGSSGDLSLTNLTGATAAFRLANAGNVTVPASGTSNVSITGGPAIDVTGTPGVGLSFDDVDSTSSTSDGINLSGLGAGTFSAGAGSTITNSTAVAFDLDGGSGAVTYDGTITSDVGRLVRVTSTTGGTKDFNGAITDNGDGDGGELGIQLSANTGATVRLDGGVVVRTTTQPAFTATGGGTVAVPAAGGANTLDATTGTPLTVTGTAIHGDGLTFRRIASNGAANGIVLSGTGAGRLAVTGGGGACTVAAPACTGGTITGSTGAGISLTNVPGGTSLASMRVTQGGDDGIRATTVTDVDLTDVLVTANGNSHAGGLEERGLDYLDVTGTPQILRTVVSGSDDSNAHIRNTTGTTTLTVDESTFSGSKNNAGLRLRGEGSSTMTATVEGSVFSLNADPGFSMQTDAANTARQTLTFNDNDVSGGSANAVPGRPQVSINAGGGSTVKVSVTNNDIKSAAGAELILNTIPGHTGVFDAKVVGNDISDAQPGALDPLVDGGTSIWGWAHGSGATRMEIRNNTIANWGGRALELSHNDGTGTADYTVTGNLFSNPDVGVNVFEGVYIVAGGATGDTSNVCVDLENNTGLETAVQPADPDVPDILMDLWGSAQLRFADVNVATVAAVQASLLAKNPGSPGLTFDTFSNPPTATPATACTLTVGTP